MKLTEIYRSIQESKIILGEALDLATARKYTSIKRNPEIQKRIDSIFNKLSNLKNSKSSKRGDRIYVPLSTKSKISVNQYSQKTSTDISNVFAPFQYKIEDYFSNKATDEYDRQTKITKLLAKIAQSSNDQIYADQAKKLLKKYNNDPDRSGKSSNVSSYLVFSKHQYDIAGMSTDRGWTSCMNLYDGSKSQYVQYDIEEGTIICYLISSNDKNIEKPIARVLIKPFINVDDAQNVLYAVDKEYGTAPSNFRDQVQNIVDKIQGEKSGRFELVRSLVCDLSHTKYRMTNEFKPILNGKRRPKNKDEVKQLLEFLEIYYYYEINEDLSVDVYDNVNISYRDLKVIPVNFGKVTRKFSCSGNQLTSLQGAPKEVGKQFNCSFNKLTSLEGAPQTVDGNFICRYNDLTSLEGSPQTVDGDFNCSDNKLTSLQGAPQTVDGHFDCSFNKLTSLKGAPQTVNGGFICSDNDLTSLEGSPQKMYGLFACERNQLKSLEGAPQTVKGDFYCFNNQLTSLKGAPQKVGGDFKCSYNTKKFTEEEVRSVSDVDGNVVV